MKKILVIIDDLSGGGAEKVLIDILENVDKKKYKIELFLLRNEGIYVKKVEELGIKINYLLGKRKDIINNIFYRKIKSLIIKIIKFYILRSTILCNKILNRDYDIEIAFLEGEATLFLSQRKNSAKKLGWVHIDIRKRRIFRKSFEEKIYKKLNKIIFVSRDSQKNFLEMYPKLFKKTDLIYNPIPKEKIIRNSIIENEVYSKTQINLIVIGRLTYQKGYDILLQAHKKLLKEGLNYNLYILGEGGERKKIEKYIRENNIYFNTFLLGFKENPYPYINQADIFVSSSRYEGYPLVLCEALCLEKPIIATKCTGPSEILEDGKYGLLAEVENVDSLAENIKKLIINENLRKEYSDLAKERAKIFDINKTMKEIERLFDE